MHMWDKSLAEIETWLLSSDSSSQRRNCDGYAVLHLI